MSDKPGLLSGGNPQIPKGDGDGPVQAYIAAMPGWKQAVGKRLDAIISKHLPGCQKAVKYNTPFYGIKGQGWLIGYHCMERYIKVSFFAGRSLVPMPPETSKDANMRYVHIHEDDDWDEAQLAAWVEQSASLDGWLTADLKT